MTLDVLSSDSGMYLEESTDSTHLTPARLYETPTIEDNTAPVLNSLTPDMSSPQTVGNPIAWIANAYDSDGDSIYYKFWLAKENNMTGDVWLPMNDWSTENIWTWVPDSEGNYKISVMARDGYHTNSPDEGDASIEYNYNVISVRILNPAPLKIEIQPTSNR